MPETTLSDSQRRAADHVKVGRSFSVVGASTMASRVLGMVRDIVTANAFGTGMAISAFVIAFRIPNLFRRLLGEGALTAAFVPLFTGQLEKEGRERAWHLANIVASVLAVTLMALVALAMVVLWLLTRYASLSPKWRLTFELAQVMFPYLLFVSLAALAMGILNSFQHFAMPALSPVLLNLFMIASVFLICPRLGSVPETAIFGLAIGVLLGGTAQLVSQVPWLWKHGMRYRFHFKPRHEFVQQVVRLMGPGIFGVAVFQLNVTIDSVLAMWLGPSSPAILYYADRLMELPLGVFSISVATAILPMLSRYAARGEIGHMKDLLNYGLRMVFFINIPATVGLIILGRPIIELLFQRKHAAAGFFNVNATVVTLACFALGLCAFSFVNVLARFFYALKDTKTPVKVAAASLLVNIAASLSLMWWLREAGLALAATLASTFNALTLLLVLRKRVGLLGGRRLLRSGINISVASAGMAVVCLLTLKAMAHMFPLPDLTHKLLRVLIPLLAGGASYFAAAKVLRLREFGELLAILRLGRQTPPV